MNVAALLQDSPSDDHRRRHTQSQQQNQQNQQNQHQQSQQEPDRQRPQPSHTPHERERSGTYPSYVPAKSADPNYPPYNPTPDPHKSPTYPPYRPSVHQRHPSDPSQSQAAPGPYDTRPNAPVPPPPRVRQLSNVSTAPSSSTGPGVGGTPSSMYMPPPDFPHPHPHPQPHPHHPHPHPQPHSHSSHKSTGSGSTPLYPTPVSVPPPASQSTQSQSTRQTPSHTPPLNSTYSDPSPMYHGPPPPPPAQRRTHPQPAAQAQSPAMASLRPLDIVPGSGGSGSAGESAWGPGKRSGSSAEDSRERAGERSGASLIMMDWQGERVGIRERERERDLGEMDRAGRERERRENGGRKSSGTSGSAAIDDPPHLPQKQTQTRPGGSANPGKRPNTNKKSSTRNEDGMDVDDIPTLPSSSSTRERELRERERDVRDREREQREREREREREKEQRERDREDMDIIRAAASTRQQGHTRTGQGLGQRGRENTPTAELLVLQHTNVNAPGQGHAHGHSHGHAHHTHGHGHVHNHNHPPHPSHPSLAPHPPHPSLMGGGLAPHSNHPSLGVGMAGLAPHSSHPSLGMGVVPHSSHASLGPGGSAGGGDRERGERGDRGGDRGPGVLGVPPHSSHPSLPPPPPPSLQLSHPHQHQHPQHQHHGSQILAPQHPSQLQQSALPSHSHQQMHAQTQALAEAQQTLNQNQAPNPPPQRQFQNQFHTQFVPGLQVGPGSPLPLPVGVEGRDREKDVIGKKARSGVIQLQPVGVERDEGRGRGSGGKSRSRRDRDGGGGGVRGDLNGVMMDVDVGVGVVEWEKEREVKARVTVHLGTYVYPRTPFPYFFGEAAGGGGVEKAVGKGKEEAETATEVKMEGENGKKDNDVATENEKQSNNRNLEGNGNEHKKENENENKSETQKENDSEMVKETDKDLLDRETRATIIIPSGFLPLAKPPRPRIWGGGVVPPTGAIRPETRGRRRVYTDDSDLFLCALHAGWVTWSEGHKARDEGKDMKIEVRVLRCAGTGVVGGGKDLDSGGGVGMGSGKEEVMGRFVGGSGERCHGGAGSVVGVKKEGEREREKEKERRREEQEEDEDGGDGEVEMEIDGETSDEDNDGRGLESAGWGSGHDGSGIEVLGAEFVEKGTARKALGLGLRNRSQRLSEYSERRAAILGLALAPGCGMGAKLAGRKRRRGWDWPLQHHRRLPNAVALDSIEELEEENEKDVPIITEVDPRTEGAESDCDEDTEMKIRTVVFGFGARGDVHAGFKYDPAVLRAVLFPKAYPDRDSWARRPPKKRRRLDVNAEDLDVAMDVDLDESKPSSPSVDSRHIVLETAKESFMLSPSLPDGNPGEIKKNIPQGGRRYVISLILAEDTEGVDGGNDEKKQAYASADPSHEPSEINEPLLGKSHNHSTGHAVSRPPSQIQGPDSTTHPQEASAQHSTVIVSADGITATEKAHSSQPNPNLAGSSLPSANPLIDPAVNKSPLSSPLPPSRPELPPAPKPISSVARTTDTIKEHGAGSDSLPVPNSATPLVSSPGLSKPAEIRTPKLADPVEFPPNLQSTPVTADNVSALAPVPQQLPIASHNDSLGRPSVQILRRDLGEELILFTEDAIKILDDLGDGLKKEWSIAVKRWKWAPQRDCRFVI